MRYRAAIALGSNLGDRLATLRSAVSGLGRLGTVVALSSLYETAPVGGPDQGAFLNAVAILETELEPPDLLDELLALESEHGRVREERWGPRTLDLDIVTARRDGETVVVDSDLLRLPHPRAGERRFVLEPLAEVWPDATVSGSVPAGRALAQVLDQEVERLGGDWSAERWATARLLVGIQVVLFGIFAAVALVTGTVPEPGRPSTWAGVVVAVGGLVLSGWAVMTLGPAVSPHPEPRPGTTLVASGPYRHLRHPIYTGLILAAFGVALLLRSWPAALTAVVIAAFFAGKARYEETRLRISVPGYAAYQRRVRRMIFVPKGPD